MNSLIRIIVMIVIVTWVIMLTIHSHGQTFDAPSTAKPPERTCGPKWAGGCYMYGHGKTNLETLRDPYFLWPTIADGVVTSLDSAVTSYGVGHSPCEEANGDLGRHPSNARIAGINALIFGVNTGFRFLAIKVVPKDSKSKLVWIPRAFTIGSAIRSGVVHIRGARTWFTGGCL